MNIKEKTKKEKDETVTDDIRGLPVDRGYAWVIAVACLFCNIICLGMQRAYGVLLVEIFRMFQTSAGVTTTILTVQSCVVSIAGLLTQTVVLSFLSVRQTVVIGGFLGGLGLILSYFAQTVFMLYFTISLLVGLSMAMVFGPTLVIVGTYFCQRRSLASAIAVLGGNIGSTVMPLYLQTLISTFGGRGALLVVGATYWHVMVGGLLLRPLHLNKARKCTEDKLKAPVLTDGADTSARQTRGCAETSSLLSVNSHVRDDVTKTMLSSDKGIQEFNNISDKEDSSSTKLQEIKEHSHGFDNTDHVKLENCNIVCSADRPDKDKTVKNKQNCSDVFTMLDFRLFKNRKFVLLIVSLSLGDVPAALYGTYLPPLAADKGLTGQEGAMLLSVFGTCGAVARLFFGFVADLNLVPRPVLAAILIGACSVAGMFTPFYTSFTSLVVFSALYGVFGPVFFSICPVVIVDLLGLENLGPTLGFVTLFQAAAEGASHALTGYLRDVTSGYHSSFYFMSTCGLLCAAMLPMTSLTIRDHSCSPQTTHHEMTQEAIQPIRSETSC